MEFSDYLPTALTVGLAVAISLGGYRLHKDFKEIRDSVGSMLDEETFVSSFNKLYNQMAVQGSILISKLKGINYRLGEMHGDLQEIHEEFVAHNSLDSVVTSP